MVRTGLMSAFLAGLLTLAQWAVAFHQAEDDHAHASAACEICLSAVAGEADAPEDAGSSAPVFILGRAALIEGPREAVRRLRLAAYASRAPPRA